MTYTVAMDCPFDGSERVPYAVGQRVPYAVGPYAVGQRVPYAVGPYAVGQRVPYAVGAVLLVLVCIVTIVWVPRQHMLREKHYDEWDTPLDVPDMFMQSSFPPFAAPTLVNRHLDVVSDIVHLLRQHWMQNVVYLFQIQPDMDGRHVNATLVLRSPVTSGWNYTVPTVRFTFECLEPGQSNWTAVSVLEMNDWPPRQHPGMRQPIDWPPLRVSIPYCLSDPQWQGGTA